VTTSQRHTNELETARMFPRLLDVYRTQAELLEQMPSHDPAFRATQLDKLANERAEIKTLGFTADQEAQLNTALDEVEARLRRRN
jgi:hypothetical protein